MKTYLRLSQLLRSLIGGLVALAFLIGFQMQISLPLEMDKKPLDEIHQAGFLTMLKEIFEFFGLDSDQANNSQPTTREIAPGVIEYTYIVPPAPIQAEIIDRNGATSQGTELVNHQGNKLIDRHAVCRNVRNARTIAREPNPVAGSVESPRMSNSGNGNNNSSINSSNPDEQAQTQAIFVPVKTAEEWASFRANLPPQVTLSNCVPGCFDYTVPPGVFRLRIVAIGAGGGGSRSTPGCAYMTLSGGGGASVVATVDVVPGDTIPYCVGIGGRRPLGTGWTTSPRNCGDFVGGNGGDTYFGGYLRARGGAGGNQWHYKNEDRRGTPPSLGGTPTVAAGTAGVTVISSNPGGTVSSRGACGGNAVIPANEPALRDITGLGACSVSAPGGNYGGGGFGQVNGHYSDGDASGGADGYLSIEPL